MPRSSIRASAARTLVRTLALSLPIVAAGATVSTAVRADESGPTPATLRVYKRLLDRFDANHDGRLQVSELPQGLQQRLAAADADHDGVLTPEELHTFGVARRAARFAQADKNADGRLTPDEIGATRWEWLKVADANHDNAVTLDEIERAVAAGTLRRMSPDEAED